MALHRAALISMALTAVPYTAEEGQLRAVSTLEDQEELRILVELGPLATARGLKLHVLKSDIVGRPSITSQAIACHIETQTGPVEGLLIARALTADGEEIARARHKFVLREAAFRYIRFVFDPEIDSTRAAKVSVDFKK